MKDGFLNPYQFIEFPAHKSKKYEDGDRHSGVIEYRVTTRTPLFIPNTSNNDAFRLRTNEEDKETGKLLPDEKQTEHISQDFFSYHELKPDEGDEKTGFRDPKYCRKPVIPGSELRGMVRGIYETLTASCMGVLNADEYPVKRTMETFKAGLLQKTQQGYKLHKAFDYVYQEEGKTKTFEETEFVEGQKLYFSENSVNRNDKKPVVSACNLSDGDYEGWLIKGMKGPEGGAAEKKHGHIFVLDESKDAWSKRLDCRPAYRLLQVLASYQEQPDAENSYKDYEKALRSFIDGRGEEYFPVYYSWLTQTSEKQEQAAKQTLYLAPACYTKELSHYSVGDLAGELNPCETLEDCCPACDLFGMTGKTNETAMASRIRFADAQAEEKEDYSGYYGDIVTLQTLGGPKLGNAEFYLKRPAAPDGTLADFWTYDYYIVGEKLYLSPGTLRGRKYYWHQPGVSFPKGITRTKLNKTVRPVKEGITFTAKLYFDGISSRQLDQLLWILDGGKTDVLDGLTYKLGNAKPLGLGSVDLSVVRKTERQFEPVSGGIRYSEDTKEKEFIEIPEYSSLGFEKSCRDEFFLLSSFMAAKNMDVTYPVLESQRGQPVTEGFKWFAENHAVYHTDKSGKQKPAMLNLRTKMETHFELPDLKMFGSLDNMDALRLPYNPTKEQAEWEAANRKTRLKKEYEFLKGVDYDGVVADYKVKGSNCIALKVDVADSKQVQVYTDSIKRVEHSVNSSNLKTKFPVGTQIRIRYDGKNQSGGKEYDKFSYRSRK